MYSRHTTKRFRPKRVRVAEMPQELPATLRHVDVLVKAIEQRLQELIIVESQVEHDEALRKTMLLRAALVHHHYDLPVRTLLMALTARAVVSERYLYGRHRDRGLYHRVEVKHVYREDGLAALEHGPQVVLPLVPLMAGAPAAELFEQTLLRIAALREGRERKRQYVGWAATFATLRLKRDRIDAIVKDVSRRRNFMMNALKDLPLLRDTYQEGKEEGLEAGVKKGKKEGTKEGKKEGLEDARRQIRQAIHQALEERMGPLSAEDQALLSRCEDLIELSALVGLARQAKDARQARAVLAGLAPRRKR